MLQQSPTLRFLCPHCNGKSKLPEPLPKSGLFKISCALCKNQSLIRFSPTDYIVEKKLPPISTIPSSFSTINPTQNERPNSPTPPLVSKTGQRDNNSVSNDKDKPFWERKFFSFPHANKQKKHDFQENLPVFFRSLKDRLAGNESNQNFPRNKTTEKRKILPVFYWGGLAILLFFVTLFTYLGTGILQTKSELNSLLGNLSKGKPTKILDRNGIVVSEIFQKRISTLKLEEYPEHLVTALLNVEDRNFYSHGGVDTFALIRAIFTNIINLSYKQGASTITQQLARIVLDDRRKSLARKWKELELALTLETYLSKEEILEAYMNNVYLGHGAYGFGEAIKFYFGKNPSEITRTEAILLATLASAPNRNSPLKNPSSSKERLDYMMQAFKNRGVISEIPKGEIAEIYTKFSTRSPNETVYGNRHDVAPYVTEHVRSFLRSLNQGENIYDEGGYIVETTIIRDIQKNLEPIVYNYLQSIQKRGNVRQTVLKKKESTDPREVLAMKNLLQEASLSMEIFSSSVYNPTTVTNSNTLQAAIIAIDPNTGEVLFMHGGDKFQSKNQFNRTYQMKRQTGSSIKPILYASAINSGIITTADKILDAPLIYRGVQGLPNWTPDNIGKKYDGEISLRYALVKSKNTAAVQIAEKLGYTNLDMYFSSFFFPNNAEKEKRFRNDLSLSLGSLELSPLEMASAFGAFSNQGKILRPYLIRKVVDPEGNVIFERGEKDEFDLKIPTERSVIKPDTAEVMLSLLKDSGKSSGIYRSGYKGLVAGKTGTTNDNKDAWFMGLRPGISLAIWIGYDNHRYGMGPGGLGGAVAAPLWGEIMKIADKEKALPTDNFPPPAFAVSGKICGGNKITCSDCPPGTEWFIRDNVIEESCTDYVKESEEKREVLQELF